MSFVAYTLHILEKNIDISLDKTHSGDGLGIFVGAWLFVVVFSLLLIHFSISGF